MKMRASCLSDVSRYSGARRALASRGIEGKITAIQYAREHNDPVPWPVPWYAAVHRGVCPPRSRIWKAPTASSWIRTPQYPVIALMPDQNGVEDIGGTLRLGSFPCMLDKTSKAYELYGEELIHERHRHRYEVNNDYRAILTEHGMTLSGLSPDGRIVEMIELKDHPFFIATQAHPELKSRPNRPHPLFKGFVEAALKAKK